MMKKGLSFFMLLCLGAAPAWAQAQFQKSSSRHFEIYYEESVEESFVKEALDFAEKYYDELTEKLGFVRYDYWTWDDRAKIYIYADAESYLADTGQPAWSGGLASYKEKTIRTFPRSVGFFDSLLPHEIGHIIFRDVIGSHAVPLWLEEGVACYLEPARRFGSSKMVKDAVKDGTFIPLEELNTMDPRATSDAERVELFYAESVSLLTFLIEEFGVDRFNRICDRVRDGKPFERALQLTLFGVQDLGGLSRMWEDSLRTDKKGGSRRRTML